ncbi:MAG TPA: tRNA (adenosine(37)-N6)-threonylcarbamoyltransferase complex dimerization subunit type 1 TsaB [Bacteroidales bacterium]|nr:MAG: tRNA (adenosine(37)-N6)-threonylcarbamoyltransferase complex dimerization subunit type 1 TsaB [Bacteroidetes bacterium GWF2_33_38]OFY76008.1 MAG: tRNA (adenosine(37)-N6)-threonylcarbamoyltransferase complex dimerization subunit type 1 TsaB [Bacteroidetes bacterium RIFOXYA12_FULL_33_9]OFY90062.1 MAG: tRNA (adenosine(37)-N6)-threonylcarbamoyltransferase complex dimerization subunit type 1 TsaB [Bacteroidetes bacterium RIFOXYA2_FULL_33_7]HBF87649.1 tRNA (adenosine(37)-N6)-threonylcarbamoylt
MALILNIETSSPVCSVCIAKDGQLLSLKETTDEKSHASLLTVFINEVLIENKINIRDLDAVAVSEGPGSYTGLRIGVSTAKGICYGIEKPLIAVSTLEALTFAIDKNNISAETWFCPMIDARRMEVYSVFFDKNGVKQSEILPHIIDADSFKNELHNRQIVFFGTGAEKCKPMLTSKNAIYIDNIMPSSSNMISLSEKAFQHQNFVNLAYFEPFYLKEFMATTPKIKF